MELGLEIDPVESTYIGLSLPLGFKRKPEFDGDSKLMILLKGTD